MFKNDIFPCGKDEILLRRHLNFDIKVNIFCLYANCLHLIQLDYKKKKTFYSQRLTCTHMTMPLWPIDQVHCVYGQYVHSYMHYMLSSCSFT